MALFQNQLLDLFNSAHTMLEISKKLATCLNVVKRYEWLLDSYVLVRKCLNPIEFSVLIYLIYRTSILTITGISYP